jgi:hypothetical protein
MQAEEKVLAELILLAPEDEEEDDSLPPEDLQLFEDLRRIRDEDDE